MTDFIKNGCIDSGWTAGCYKYGQNDVVDTVQNLPAQVAFHRLSAGDTDNCKH